MAKATTVRFTEEVYQRLDQASARTGMPVNSIVVAACLEWMQRHTPTTESPRVEVELPPGMRMTAPPRWATIRRAIDQVVARPSTAGMYPFERFSESAQRLLTAAQAEAKKSGTAYIGTEHLLIACFADPEFHSARILTTLGAHEDDARKTIKKLLTGKRPPTVARVIPTSRVKRVIEMAFGMCETMGDPRVGTKHILLALATEGEGIAAHVLRDLGATRQKIDSEAAKLTEPES